MERLLGAMEDRFGLARSDLLGLVITLVGCVVATVVALRVPLLASFTAPAAPGDGLPAAAALADEMTGGVVLVHVAGAVRAPGIVELPVGARVDDALAAAGGPLDDAAVELLNLARPVVDGEQVLVPRQAAPGENPAPSSPGAADPTLPDGRIDLNAATATDLEELPGVGPVLAGRIVAYREEHGPFVEAVGLRDVSGIGEATWLRLRELVGVR